MLLTLKFWGGLSGYQLFLVIPNFWSNLFSFTEHSYLSIFLGFGGAASVHQLCLVVPILRSKNFQNFFLYQARYTLNFLQGGPGTNFFLLHQIWGQKVFRIFSFTEHSGLWIYWGVPGTNFFLSCQSWCQKFFRIFSFIECSWLYFPKGVQTPTFFSHAKFETKNFLEFFPLLSAHDSEILRGYLDTNFFW